NGMIYEEKEDVIVVKRPGKDPADERTPDTYASVSSREVKISAVFFEMDVNQARQRGMDWKFLLSGKGFNIGSEIISETRVPQQAGGETTPQPIPPSWRLGSSAEGQIGNFFGEATAVFKFFEQENLGEILASPNIIVRDKNQGRIQIGSDFSVRTR